MKKDTLVTNISELVTASSRLSTKENPLGRIRDAAIGIRDGKITFVGKTSELTDEQKNTAKTIDAKGAVVFPGLIDSHTHPVFGGSREDEFAKRVAGVPYMEIAKQGGGILSTVRATRAASHDELFKRSSSWLSEMLALGTTTIEAKSGYGLDTKTELKQLDVINELNQKHEMDLVATFLGAHEFPLEYRDDKEKYVDLVVDEMLPAVKNQGVAKFCDAFVEEGVFDVKQAKRIMIKAKELGFSVRFHADEFVDSGGAILAADLGATAVDHLTAITNTGIEKMRDKSVIAAILPATTYYLGHSNFAPARNMIDNGVKVVIASDFNPGSSVTFNLQLVANIACTRLRMTFEEVVLAITRYASESLEISDKVGSIEKGKQADFLMLDIPVPEYFVYHFGRNHVHKVFKKGEKVFENQCNTVFI